MTTEPNEAALKLAREIAAKQKVGAAPEEILAGDWDQSPLVQSTLAAILEVTERAVKFNERHAWEWSIGTMNASLRNMEHLA